MQPEPFVGSTHQEPEDEGMTDKTVTFSIEGMHCRSCVRRVSEALARVDGLDHVTVDVGTATFLTDDDGVVDEAKAAVVALGFAVVGDRTTP
jgi:copper chaperone CopZ